MKSDAEYLQTKRASLAPFFLDEIPRIRASIESAVGGDFLADIEEYEKERNTFISKFRRVPLGSESFMVILRRWNSYTPSLPADEVHKGGLSQYSVGGVYFLFLQSVEGSLLPGYGLVIDPGYNFIHNFGAAGFGLDDIDGILMTHAHNDHTNDFESLLSLLFQRNHRHLAGRRPKQVDLFLNVGSFKKFSNYLDLARVEEKDYIGKVIVMSPGQVHHVPGRDDIECSILTLHTNHHEIVTADYSLGLCFKIGDRNILLTGDTGWRFETALRNENFLSSQGVYTREEAETGNVDLLVSHIGTVTRAEFEYNADQSIDSVFYDKHLGALGVIAIVEQWKPNVCVISEFGEELTRVRTHLVREIETTLKKLHSGICCIPGDVGLFMFLDSEKSLCYSSRQLVDVDSLAYEETESDGVRSIKYYSRDTVEKLDPDARAEFVRSLRIVNGLASYRKQYLTKVAQEHGIEDTAKESLVSAFGLLSWDYDPWSMESYSSSVRGLLFALSAVINDPRELLDIISENPYSVETASVYDSYHAAPETAAILKGLTEVCWTAGYGQNTPSSVDRILNERHPVQPKAVLDACKAGDIDGARAALQRLRDRTLGDVWPDLPTISRLCVLQEDRVECDGLPLTHSEEHSCELYRRYTAAVQARRSQLDALARVS